MRDSTNILFARSLVALTEPIANRKLCGEGFPDWAVVNAPNLHAFPFPVQPYSYPVNATTQYPV